MTIPVTAAVVAGLADPSVEHAGLSAANPSQYYVAVQPRQTVLESSDPM